MLAGISLVIASACVCNNYLDRDIDRKMDRTRGRALVRGDASPQAALTYAAVLGVVGLGLLLLFTNLITAAIGLFGFIAYVFIYGYAKRRSVHGTVVGSISGAIPPVVGYCAVSGRLDLAALLLFLVLVCWQMPHFYAIAIFRMADYKAAGIPVHPLVAGMRATKLQMLAYIGAFTAAGTSLSLFGYTSLAFGVFVVVLGWFWFWQGLRGLRTTDDVAWARKLFGASLLVLLLFCVGLGVDSFLYEQPNL